ncbi:XRE family transcriptional regulator [Acutalibacter sp. 1XD8-33]|uniref:helix-turn-helix domain-containing protein n=1 Tax=Acutalibacter sp. 1XD8-33 TaxID=2320081 RepID=UPI000EA3C469|nr:helix-turn-helix domain-containing protein [Acutalibacter sp. 1XD8-33]RKJ39985.1 XRE family transcriptional regulator [Acutalibacter sp. 1XD8-33]
MDQIKTGRFIAEERKRKGFTQRRLAEALGISDKTVSKWECGNGFPDVSLLLPLCGQLDVSVNELLAGERVSTENYRKKAEENMVDLIREAQESKKKIILSALVAVMMLLAAIPLIVISGMLEMAVWLRVVLVGVGAVEIVLGIAVACVLDHDAGAFECPVCGERFVPGMWDYVMGAHTITKRRLRCPQCGAKKYCKKVMTKTK